MILNKTASPQGRADPDAGAAVDGPADNSMCVEPPG
jgi:hypothetical protein